GNSRFGGVGPFALVTFSRALLSSGRAWFFHRAGFGRGLRISRVPTSGFWRFWFGLLRCRFSALLFALRRRFLWLLRKSCSRQRQSPGALPKCARATRGSG